MVPLTRRGCCGGHLSGELSAPTFPTAGKAIRRPSASPPGNRPRVKATVCLVLLATAMGMSLPLRNYAAGVIRAIRVFILLAMLVRRRARTLLVQEAQPEEDPGRDLGPEGSPPWPVAIAAIDGGVGGGCWLPG